MTSGTKRGSRDWDIVIVSHNSEAVLRQLWGHGVGLDEANIVVVDNDSADGSVEAARTFANQVIRSPNHGLAKSNNIGASYGDARYILFCNPDVKITDADLGRLGIVLAHRGGLVAPRLVGSGGVLQPNARLYPTLAKQLARKWFPSSRLAVRYLWPDVDKETTFWVTGACLAISREDFGRLGGWPETHFLYFEDVDLCQKAIGVGLSISLDEDVKVVHLWNQESRRVLSKASRLHAASALRYYLKQPKRIISI